MQDENYLFGSIVYKSTEDVDKLIENMTTEQSFYMISESINYANKAGLFSLLETEILSKSLRIIHKKL